MNQDISISRLLIENLPIAFAYHQIILDRQGKPVDYIFIDINPAFETVIRLKKDQVIGKKVTELLPVINRSGFDWIAAFGQVAGSGNSACFKKYFEPLGGWYEIVACSDRPGYFAMLLRDITRKKKVQKRLRENEALFRLLVEHMGCGLVVEDCQRNIVLANQAFCEMFSIPGSPEELQGKNSSFLVEKAKLLFTDPHHFALCLEELIAGRQAIFDQEVRFVDGRIFCQDYTPVLEEDSSIMGHMWQYWDITGRKQIEDQLRYLSLHDQLTGLYNRAYFENELHRLSKSREFPVSILSVDLDGLKLINDASGHLPGDSYLKAVAEILRRSLRASDILSRVGGDEFAALLPSTGYNSGEEIVKRIQSRVDQYNRNHQDQLPLSISIGLATAENKEQSLKKTFKEADEHMYRIKLYRGVDARAQMIKTLLTTLGERDMITEGHARRLEKLCLTIGRKIKLSSSLFENGVISYGGQAIKAPINPNTPFENWTYVNTLDTNS